MTVGQQTIEWLYSEQLKVDAEWSVRTPRGFKWWAHKQAQTIEVIGQERGPDGNNGYFISVRTEVLRSVTLDEQQRAVLDALKRAGRGLDRGAVPPVRCQSLAR